jgi:hypothetical protein
VGALSERATQALRRSQGGSVERLAATLRRSGLRRVVQHRRHRGLGNADAYLASYPRSGNTWLRFVLVQLATGAPADFMTVDRLSPPVGVHGRAPALLAGGGRLVKTHEPWRPEYRRGLYLVRDPRDVVVSWYSLLSPDPASRAGLDEFVVAFARGRTAGYGAWDAHVRGWLAAAEREPGLRIERFETMRADVPVFVTRAAAFLGIAATPDDVRGAVAFNSRERMRGLEADGLEYLKGLGWRSQGVRDGLVGSWRDVLTERHLRDLRPALAVAAELGYEV